MCIDHSPSDFLATHLIYSKVSCSVERGEKNGHPHVQMAIRVRTRRTLKYTKELLEVLLKFVVYAHAELSNRVSVIARGTQSQLYNLGYPWKDMEEGDLFHAPSPLPEAAGHYRLGMSDDRCKEADLAYKSFAHDQANKTAYAKGGANRPGRYTGNKKKYAISKSSYLDFGYDLVEDEKFGEDGRRASAVKKTAWLLERGRHYLGPSWCTPYGKNQVDEEQVTCLELVNNVPLHVSTI